MPPARAAPSPTGSSRAPRASTPHGVDVARFAPAQGNRHYLHERTRESLGRLYAMHWPQAQSHAAGDVRRTPLYRSACGCRGAPRRDQRVGAAPLVRPTRGSGGADLLLPAPELVRPSRQRSTARPARPWRSSTSPRSPSSTSPAPMPCDAAARSAPPTSTRRSGRVSLHPRPERPGRHRARRHRAAPRGGAVHRCRTVLLAAQGVVVAATSLRPPRVHGHRHNERHRHPAHRRASEPGSAACADARGRLRRGVAALFDPLHGDGFCRRAGSPPFLHGQPRVRDLRWQRLRRRRLRSHH